MVSAEPGRPTSPVSNEQDPACRSLSVVIVYDADRCPE